MTLTEQVAKNIIRKLLKGVDYRIEVVTLINAEFLQFAIEFFKKIIDAKLKNKKRLLRGRIKLTTILNLLFQKVKTKEHLTHLSKTVYMGYL